MTRIKPGDRRSQHIIALSLGIEYGDLKPVPNLSNFSFADKTGVIYTLMECGDSELKCYIIKRGA